MKWYCAKIDVARRSLVLAAVIFGGAAGAALAEDYRCEYHLYAVEPGIAVASLGDPAAEGAAAAAEGNPGLFVYPVTRGDISIGQTVIHMQGGHLGWSGTGGGITELAQATLDVNSGETGRLLVGDTPEIEERCSGPQYTPVYEEALGYAADVQVLPGNVPGLVHAETRFIYFVPGVEEEIDEHRFTTQNVVKAGNWSATVKRMPDGGHMILFARVI